MDLEALANVGIIIRQPLLKAINAKIYKVHKTLLNRLRMPSSQVILKKISENMKEIRKYGVKRIGLFGSYAKGKQKRGSDIDLLVEFEKGEKTFDNYMGLKLFLEDLLKRKVDLVISEAVKPELKPYIMESILYATGS
ncbi:MAG: nucleotidyltransferase family protein [Candidatus Bathyarchaeia archaeon]